MSFMEYPQPDACRALMPTPEPPPPGPPSRPMVCHMPKGHEGPHAITRHPRRMDRRWEGDARPTPPEMVVETVARALAHSDAVDAAGPAVPDLWKDASGAVRREYRRLAAAAIAALPPSPAEEAVNVEGDWIYPSRELHARDLTKSWADAAQNAGCPASFVARMRSFVEVHDRLYRAALASPAPAPQRDPEWDDRYRRGFTCLVCRGIGRTFHNDMPDKSGRAQGCLACGGTGVALAPAPQGEEGQS